MTPPAYDAAGRVTRTDLPSGKSTTNVYRHSASDVFGVRRKFEYRNASNNLTGSDTFCYDNVVRPGGSTSRYNVMSEFQLTDVRVKSGVVFTKVGAQKLDP